MPRIASSFKPWWSAENSITCWSTKTSILMSNKKPEELFHGPKLWKCLFLSIYNRGNLQIIFHVIYSSLPNCRSISHCRPRDWETGWNNNWGNIKSSGKVHGYSLVCKEKWRRYDWERSIKNSLAVRADCNEVMDQSLMGRKDCIKKKGAPTQGNLSTSFSK